MIKFNMCHVIGTIDTHPINQYLKSYHYDPSTLKQHKIKKPCKLQKYITKVMNVDHEFRRGHTYYEFTNEVENIPEGKEVLLQVKKKPNKWFRLDQNKVLSAGGLGLYYGEGIARNNFGNQYRVFIQSFGSGARHLPGDSYILYNHSDDQVAIKLIWKLYLCDYNCNDR